MSIFGPGFDKTHRRTHEERWEEQRRAKNPIKELEKWENLLVTWDTILEFAQRHRPHDEWHCSICRDIIYRKYLEIKGEVVDD